MLSSIKAAVLLGIGAIAAAALQMSTGTSLRSGGEFTVEGKRTLRLDLPAADPARGKFGIVYLEFDVTSYRRGSEGGAAIVVRRIDGAEPVLLKRIVMFPDTAFPSADDKGPRRFQVRIGECRKPGDAGCAPRLDISLDAGSRSTAGTAISIGRTALVID